MLDNPLFCEYTVTIPSKPTQTNDEDEKQGDRTSKRAAGGVIAAGKDRVNGLQQGKANGFGQVTATGTPPVIRGARIV